MSNGIELTAEMVQRYQHDGFLRVPHVLTPDEVQIYRDAALDARDKMTDFAEGRGDYSRVFTQNINVWQHHETMRKLTLDEKLGSIAERLAGVDLRIWHDQLLIKQPGTSIPTEFHQDAPYWPHNGGLNAITAWIALVDVPVQRGCMTFVPGSHQIKNLRPQDLMDSRDLMNIAPDMEYMPRVTLPLRAGDCTFHNGYVAHMANANTTDIARVAFAIIYMDADTRYSGRELGGNPHPVVQGLGLEINAGFPDAYFPRVS